MTPCRWDLPDVVDAGFRSIAQTGLALIMITVWAAALGLDVVKVRRAAGGGLGRSEAWRVVMAAAGMAGASPSGGR
ncbi:hypothetical protein GCM10018953_49560 [Streptosporangium nondiastaticum]